MPALGDLDQRVARGALITYATFFGGKIIAFANTVILARILLPEHFGLVAVGLLVLAVAESVAEAGIGAAVVWSDKDVERSAPVALAIGLIAAVLITTALVLSAPMISAFFDVPEAVEIVRVLAICILLGVPTSVFNGILQKKMQFGRRALPEVARALAKGAVGIPLALAGVGVWSLVYSHIAGVVVGLILVWRLSGWRPQLSLQRDILREILPFGLQIAAVGLVGLAIRKLDVVVIGFHFDPEQLGFYTLAFSLVELSVMGVVWSASQALFPALAQTAGNTAAMQEQYARGLTLLLAAVLPIGVGLVLTADPFIATVFGTKWATSAILLKILAWYAIVYSLGFNLGDIYKATGRPRILTLINLANLAVAVPVLILASQFGLKGVAVGQIIVALAISGLNWTLAYRFAGIGPIVLMKALRGPLPALLAMIVSCVVVDLWAKAHLSDPLRLAVLVAACGLAYGAVLSISFEPLRRRLFSRHGTQ